MIVGLKYGAPRWLVEALGRTWDKGQVYDLQEIPGFDHVRTYKGRVVISQPYETTEEIGPILTRLAERGGRMRIWGISPYFPGHTLSLVIWRDEDEACALEIMDRMHEPFASDKCEAHTRSEWS